MKPPHNMFTHGPIQDPLYYFNSVRRMLRVPFTSAGLGPRTRKLVEVVRARPGIHRRAALLGISPDRWPSRYAELILADAIRAGYITVERRNGYPAIERLYVTFAGRLAIELWAAL